MQTFSELPDAENTLLTVSRVGHAGVVCISSEAIRDGDAMRLAENLSDLAFRLRGWMVLEMSGVTGFTCCWINALIDLSKRCQRLGGKLVVVGMKRPAMAMLENTGLTKHITVVRSHAEALEVVGCPAIAPWRLKVAKALSIPVDTSGRRAAA